MRTLASICFSSTVGRWVDNAPNRLKTLLSTVSINRISVISASLSWFFIVGLGNGHQGGGSPDPLESNEFSISTILKGAIFALILLLGILEGLSAGGNMMSMERDWVVTAAAPDGRPYDLTHLNSTMRRIDLICKLIAPILISIIISATNVKIGVLIVGSMSAVSWAAELWCAKRVWDLNPRLKAPKIVGNLPDQPSETLSIVESRPESFLNKAAAGIRRYAKDFKNYFSSLVWTPSLALAFLHISALTYSATFITYLLAVGFSLDLITIARAAGSVVEISSTIVTPVGVHYLSKAQNHGRYRGQDRSSEDSATTLLESAPEGTPEEEGRIETGLERLGLWGISFQLFNLVSSLHSPTSGILTLTLCIGSRGSCSLVTITKSSIQLSPSPRLSDLQSSHIPTPPSIHPLLLPLHLPSWSLDLRPHHPTTNTNYDIPFSTLLFHRSRI